MSGGNANTKAQLRVAEEQRIASREMLLQPHTRRDTVYIDSLGAAVRIRSMTFGERERIQSTCGLGTEDFDSKRFTMMSLIACIEEPQLTQKDVEELYKQDVAVIDELAAAVTFINISGGDAEEGKGSSKPTSTSDSSSS